MPVQVARRRANSRRGSRLGRREKQRRTVNFNAELGRRPLMPRLPRHSVAKRQSPSTLRNCERTISAPCPTGRGTGRLLRHAFSRANVFHAKGTALASEILRDHEIEKHFDKKENCGERIVLQRRERSEARLVRREWN